MARAVWTALGLGLGALALYFAFWPVPVDPVAWTPPPAPGYVGPFARNDRLAAMERLSLGADHGPEAVALDAAGRIYTSTREGRILRLRPDGSGAETYADTNGAARVPLRRERHPHRRRRDARPAPDHSRPPCHRPGHGSRRHTDRVRRRPRCGPRRPHLLLRRLHQVRRAAGRQHLLRELARDHRASGQRATARLGSGHQ